MFAPAVRSAPFLLAVVVSTFLMHGPALAEGVPDPRLAGTWSLDVERSDEVPAWRRMELVIVLEDDSVILTRNLGWGRRRYSDSLAVPLTGKPVTLPLEWWADNRHLGIYVNDTRERHVSAETLDDGLCIRTDSRFTVETQQDEASMRITTEYRLHPSGDRLTLIELRSSRQKPIVHHFTRKP